MAINLVVVQHKGNQDCGNYYKAKSHFSLYILYILLQLILILKVEKNEKK